MDKKIIFNCNIQNNVTIIFIIKRERRKLTKELKKVGVRVVDVAVVQPPLLPLLRLWSCCPIPATVVVVLPLLPPLPLWWPPAVLVVVGATAVATVVWVGVTPLPSRLPLVVVGGAPAVVIVITVVVGGSTSHCCRGGTYHCMSSGTCEVGGG